MMASRPVPAVGSRALVQYLAADVGAVVRSVSHGGRHVTVVTDEGETLNFVLRRSTGQFHAGAHGPRLKLLT